MVFHGIAGFVWHANFDNCKNSCDTLIKRVEQLSIIPNPSPQNVSDLMQQLQNLSAKISELVALVKTEPIQYPTNFYTIFKKIKQRMANPLEVAIAYCEQLQKGTDNFGEIADRIYLEGIVPKVAHIVQRLSIEFGTLATEIGIDPVEKFVDSECKDGEDKLKELSETIAKIRSEIKENNYFNEAPFEKAMAQLNGTPTADDWQSMRRQSVRRHSTGDAHISNWDKNTEEKGANVGKKMPRRHSENNLIMPRKILADLKMNDGQRVIRKRNATKGRKAGEKMCQILTEMILEAKTDALERETAAKIKAIAEPPVKGDELMQLTDIFDWEWRQISDRINRWTKTDGDKNKYRIKLVETSMAAYEMSKPLKLTMVSALDGLNSAAKTEMKRWEEELHKLLHERIEIGTRAKETLAKLSMDLQTAIGLPRQIVNAQIGPVVDLLRGNGAEQSALSYYVIENSLYAAKQKVQSAFQIPSIAFKWSIFVDEQNEQDNKPAAEIAEANQPQIESAAEDTEI
ncbi:hypothetical protein niasHT_011121 [Heterodera trifolii]|uniref:Uncharacterized protein n=1 Tax=Heterodera trifolii TaxID=157864 RepID=A0ABD2LBL8_9BILA